MQAEEENTMTETDTDTDRKSTDEELLIDDHWLEGVYNDGRGGEFVRVDRDTETENLAILRGLDGSERERVSPQDWSHVQDVLLAVPERAVQDPVGHMEKLIETHVFGQDQIDLGLMYADMMTEVTERE